MKHYETALYPCANRFVLIDDFMVPFEFLEKLHDEVAGYCFDPDQVTSMQDNCSDAFWYSLTEMEQIVFGPCLLILIENGLIRDYTRHLKPKPVISSTLN